MADGDISDNVNKAQAFNTQDDIASSASLPFWGAILQFAAGAVGRSFKLLEHVRPTLLLATKTSSSVSSRLQMAALNCDSLGGKYFLNTGCKSTLLKGTGNTGNGADGTAFTTISTGSKYLLITNTDAANACWLAFGEAAAVGQGVKLTAGSSYECTPAAGNLPPASTAVHGWGVGGVVALAYLEGS